MTAPEPRLNLRQLSRDNYAALLKLSAVVDQAALDAGLEKPLLELVRIRASQINGCAFCLDMHTKDARHAGETEQRIYALNAWAETPSTPNASAPPWSSPRRSPWSTTARCRTTSTSGPPGSSASPNSPSCSG